jgi:hypothetical protein
MMQTACKAFTLYMVYSVPKNYTAWVLIPFALLLENSHMLLRIRGSLMKTAVTVAMK